MEKLCGGTKIIGNDHTSKNPGSGYILKLLPSYGGDWEQYYEIRMEWKNKKILFLVIFTGMILLPGCDDSPTRPAEGFYSYQGYRDWWRHRRQQQRPDQLLLTHWS